MYPAACDLEPGFLGISIFNAQVVTIDLGPVYIYESNAVAND